MIDKSQYNESKPLDMHNLQFDIAAERLPPEPWITEKIKSAIQGKVCNFKEFFRDHST
jgi:hypothetical protein